MKPNDYAAIAKGMNDLYNSTDYLGKELMECTMDVLCPIFLDNDPNFNEASFRLAVIKED